MERDSIRDSIDKNLYSNLSSEINEKFNNISIFIYGLRGLGAEIAKNIVLSRPKLVCICDQNIIKEADLTSNFYFDESDISKNKREDVCYQKLRKLSDSVIIEKFEGKIPDNIDKLKSYTLVIITEMLSLKVILAIESYCRENNIGFIFTCALGLSGFIFVDYNDFITFDETGEENKKFSVVSISKDTSGVVTVDESQDFSLNNGDYVIFKQVEGMIEVNDSPPRPIRIIKKNTFTIEDTTKFGEYISGGIIEQVKVPKPIYFNDFRESLENPFSTKHIYKDNNDREKELHLIIISLIEFFSFKGRLPEYSDLEGLNDFILIINENIKKYQSKNWIIKELNYTLIKKIFSFSRCEIAPITSFLGGLVTQEVIKYSGRFVPINQWFNFDFYEIISDEDFLQREYPKQIKSRYDDQILLFGEEFQNRLSELNILIVESGKYGYEFIKNCALVGLSSKSGKTIITGLDHMDTSLLNQENKKSNIICETASKINKECNYINIQKRFDLSNDDLLQDELNKDINYVFSTLKNRQTDGILFYLTNYCNKIVYDISFHHLTQSHFKYIIPNVTESYNGFRDNDQTVLINNFPDSFDHCIKWARKLFNSHFHHNLKLLHEYIDSPDKFFNQIISENIHLELQKMQNIILLLEVIRSNSFDKCLEFSYKIFYEIFNHKIYDFTFNYPIDYICKETGSRLWSGCKKFPHIIIFNHKEKNHISFIYSYSVILSNCLGIKISEKDEYYINEVIKKINKVEYKPIRYVQNNYDEETILEILHSQEKVLSLRKELKNMYNSSLKNIILSPIKFIVKNDLVTQNDFINITAKIRGSNYCIEEPELPITINVLEKKMKYSPIYSCMAGLTLIQLFSDLNNKDHTKLRNCDVNFIHPKFVFKHLDEKKEFNWKKLEIKRPITLKEFLEMFKIKFKENLIRLIFCKGLLIYENYTKNSIFNNIDKKIEDIVSDKINISDKTKILLLELFVVDLENKRVPFPVVKYSI